MGEKKQLGEGGATRPELRVQGHQAAQRLPRVLVVDDDRSLARMLAEYLAQDALLLEFVHDGGVAHEMLQRRRFDLLVLDVMLPTIDGLALLASVRALHAATPILMFSARGDDHHRILGLESGADDYLPKPFNPRELRARMLALLRRGSPRSPTHALTADHVAAGSTDSVLRHGALELTPSTGLARLGQRIARLTVAEARFLAMLIRAQGRPVSRVQLTQWVLGRPLLVADRSLDTHSSNLRRKLGLNNARAGEPELRSIRGSGYMLTLPPISGEAAQLPSLKPVT